MFVKFKQELVTVGKQPKPVKEVIEKEKGEKEQCKLKIYSEKFLAIIAYLHIIYSSQLFYRQQTQVA